MEYSEAKQYLYSDGSLRDVYVLNTNSNQLDAFMDYVRPLLKSDSYMRGGEAVPLPETYLESTLSTQEVTSLLSIPIGGSTLNCHFFDSSELELDFAPQDYDSEGSWNELSCFLQCLANAMNKDVIVTPENEQNTVFIRFSPIIDGP